MGTLIVALVVGAFELQSDSPWLSGGVAAALFPRTHLAISVNPASAGLLSGASVSVSASRPFGFKELDRTAAAAGFTTNRFAVAGVFNYSGRNGYSEFTTTAAVAKPLIAGIVAGVSVSGHRLQIEGFGSGSAVSADAGIIARPLRGMFLSGAARGFYSSSLTSTGMGAVPGTVSAAIGVCPVTGVTVSAGASVYQYTGSEFSAVTSVEPYPGVSLFFSLLTNPVRMNMGFSVAVSSVSMQYGYATHPDLPGSHLVSATCGSGAFDPRPVAFGETQTHEEAPVFPVNINTATEQQLVTVPGIGPSRASTIRHYIETYGPLQSIDQIVDIPGIGATTFENLRSYLTVQ